MEPARHTAAASTPIDRIVFVIARLLHVALWPDRWGPHPFPMESHLLKHRRKQDVASPRDVHQEPVNLNPAHPHFRDAPVLLSSGSTTNYQLTQQLLRKGAEILNRILDLRI